MSEDTDKKEKSVGKEVELKVYVAGLEDVPAFIESIDLSKFFYALHDAKDEALSEPTKENLDKYIKSSMQFFQMNGNVINLIEAYMQTKFEQTI